MLELMIFLVIRWGIKDVVIKRLDVVMLVIRSRIGFFIFMKVVISSVLLISDVVKVKICMIVVICFGFRWIVIMV